MHKGIVVHLFVFLSNPSPIMLGKGAHPNKLFGFGSKNRYQAPDTVSSFVFQYYKNEYQKSLDLGFDPSPPVWINSILFLMNSQTLLFLDTLELAKLLGSTMNKG
jgi:hypothetical protein